MAISTEQLDALLSRLEKSDAPVGEAQGLPPSMYVDADYFAFEMEALYASDWVCVGRGESIPAKGDYFTAEVAREPLIVVRGKDDVIRTLSAVCQHKGMVVTAAWEASPENLGQRQEQVTGNAGRGFQCPYHFWNYDTSGRLIGAPHMDRTACFDKADHGLPVLQTEVWNNFIFVNLNGDAPPLAPRLAQLDALLQPYAFDKLTTLPLRWFRALPFNWKILVENFMDGYHPDFLHRRLHDFAPNNSAEFLPFEPADGVVATRVLTDEPDGGFNPTFKALFPALTTLSDELRRSTLFFWLAPNLLVGCAADHVFWFMLEPVDVDHVDVSISYLFPKETMKIARFNELQIINELGNGFIINQDYPVNAAVQRGKRSRFAPRGACSWQEQAVTSIYQALISRIRRHAAAVRQDRSTAIDAVTGAAGQNDRERLTA